MTDPSDLGKQQREEPAKDLVYDKSRRTIIHKAEPMKTGMFVLHRCWKCNDGERPCVAGKPRQCEYPQARND